MGKHRVPFYHTWGYKSWVKGAPLEQQVKKQIRNLSKNHMYGRELSLKTLGLKVMGTVVGYEQDVLKGIGKWTAIHKEAIFETSVNPFKKLEWGV